MSYKLTEAERKFVSVIDDLSLTIGIIRNEDGTDRDLFLKYSDGDHTETNKDLTAILPRYSLRFNPDNNNLSVVGQGSDSMGNAYVFSTPVVLPGWKYEISGDFEDFNGESYLKNLLVKVPNNPDEPDLTIPLDRLWELSVEKQFKMYGFKVQDPREILDNPAIPDGSYMLRLNKGPCPHPTELRWEEEFRLLNATFISTLAEHPFEDNILFQSGHPISRPYSDPETDSHNFRNWYTEDYPHGVPFDFTVDRREPMNIFAHWYIKTYRIFFTSENRPLEAGFDSIQIINHGETIPRPARDWEDVWTEIAVNNRKWEFNGWFYDYDGVDVDFERPIQTIATPDFGDGALNGRLEISADWSLMEHKVTFKYWNGEELHEEDIISGEEIPIDILDLMDEDYERRPLSLHVDFDDDYGADFDLSTPIVDDKELFVKYEYLVTFINEFETLSIEEWVPFGQTATDPQPTADHYLFKGWLIENEEGNLVPFDFNTRITEPITLEADWEEIEIAVRIFDWEDEDTPIHVINMQSGGLLVRDELISDVAQDRANVIDFFQKFDGDKFEDEFDFETPIEDDLDLFVKYEYEVTFDTDGAGDIVPIFVPWGGIITGIDEPTKDHYSFINWLLDGEEFDIEDTPVLEPLDLVANWEEIFYDVRFFYWDENHTPRPMYTKSVRSGEFLLEENQTLEDFFAGNPYIFWGSNYREPIGLYETFDGEFKDEFSLENAIEDDLDLFVKYQYKVEFEGGGPLVTDYTWVAYGERVPEITPPDTETHEFKGWFIDENTLEDEFDFTTPITKPLVLFSKWEEIVSEERNFYYGDWYGVDARLNTNDNTWLNRGTWDTDIFMGLFTRFLDTNENGVGEPPPGQPPFFRDFAEGYINSHNVITDTQQSRLNISGFGWLFFITPHKLTDISIEGITAWNSFVEHPVTIDGNEYFMYRRTEVPVDTINGDTFQLDLIY